MALVVEPLQPGRADRSVVRTALVPVGLAALAGALVVWGCSYPGFPVLLALAALLCGLGALLLTAARARGVAALVVAALVAVTLAAGAAAPTLVGQRPLQARWAASQPDFEAYVARLPPPATSVPEGEGSAFRAFPSGAACPARLGRMMLSECLSIGGGYLFLQAPDALTDSSGIAYLPMGTDDGLSSLGRSDLTPLGGPWWSWTCHC